MSESDETLYLDAFDHLNDNMNNPNNANAPAAAAGANIPAAQAGGQNPQQPAGPGQHDNVPAVPGFNAAAIPLGQYEEDLNFEGIAGQVQALPVDIYLHGVADIKGYYDRWLNVDPIYRGLVFRNLAYGIFSEQWNNSDIISCVAIVTAGRVLYLHDQQVRPNADSCYAVIMAELLGPCLNRDLFLGTQEAREVFVQAIKALLASERLGTITNADKESYIAAALEGIVQDQQAAHRPTFENHWTQAEQGAEFHSAYMVCLHLAKEAKSGWKMSGLSLLVHTYVSVLKRGTVTTGFLRKIQRGIEADIGNSIEFRVEALKAFYDFFGEGIDANSIKHIIAWWKSLLPQHALRLVLTVNQTAGGGLTSIISIGRAVYKYQNFKWSIIKSMFPDDWQAALTAMATIDGDPYYGFNRDLRAVRSTLYKSLVYVAMQLLIKVGGESSLTAYGGLPTRTPNIAAVDLLITQYEQQRANWMARQANAVEPVDDEPDAIDEMLELINGADDLYKQ